MPRDRPSRISTAELPSCLPQPAFESWPTASIATPLERLAGRVRACELVARKEGEQRWQLAGDDCGPQTLSFPPRFRHCPPGEKKCRLSDAAANSVTSRRSSDP